MGSNLPHCIGFQSSRVVRGCNMTNFPNSEFPINSADCAEIEAMFIELMRQKTAGAAGQPANAATQLHDLSGNERDLSSL